MDPQTAFKFIEELRLQCRFATLAWQNVQANLQTLDTEKTFLYVHALLHHASGISRILWPDREASRTRGEFLRKELQVPDDSPLRLRELRAQLERSDEAYEDWLSGLANRNYLDMNLMPQGTISAYKPDTFQRDLDPDTFKFHLRNAPGDLRKIADAAHQLEQTAARWMNTHKPW